MPHHSRKAILPLAMGLLLAVSGCKPMGEESGLMTDSGNKTIDASGVEQFNLAEWIAKKGIGGTGMKNHIKAGNGYIFFNSNEAQKKDTANATDLAKSKNKAKISLPEFEFRLNATVVSDSKKVQVQSELWFDGSMNGKAVYSGGKAVIADITGQAKSGMSLHAGVKAFGKDLISQTLTVAKPFKFTKSIDLEHTQTLIGIPALAGVQAGGSFVASATIEGDVDYLTKESITYAMVPSVKVSAGIQAGVKALKFASATAKGTVAIIDTKMPSSATLGGRAGTGAFLYGNVTFEESQFKALDGDITIGAHASVKGALPAGVDPAYWSPTTTISKTLKNVINAAQFEWSYVVWDPPPLLNVTFPTYYSNSFLQSSAPKAACAAPILTKVNAEVTKQIAKDGSSKKVESDAEASLKAILAKAKAIKGTCTGA